MGSALKGSKLGEFWKYRVGDYRIICRIEDKKLLILVLRISYRREVYRGAANSGCERESISCPEYNQACAPYSSQSRKIP
jgi:hypothetical protein